MRLFILIFLLCFAASAVEYPASVKMVNGTPTLHINDQPVYASAMRWILGIGSIDKFLYAEEYSPMRQFREAGVPVIILGMDSGWKGAGKFDYSAIDKGIDKVLTDYPDAWLLPSIHLESARWYSAVFPDEAFTLNENGKLKRQGGSIIASFNSRKFENDAKDALTRFVGHMTEKGYSKRIIGYQINYGATAEWRYWDQGKNRPDWNSQSIEAWRKYVQEKYQTIEQLNSAWQSSWQDFAAILPPQGSFRNNYRAGYLRDPSMDREVADYADFSMASVAHLIHSFSAHVKELTDGRALVGLYSFFNYPELLPYKTVDFAVSSTAYPDRAANGTAFSQARGVEYLRRAGIIYWHDSDMRTYLWPDELWGVCRNVYESIMVMRREFLSMFINGAGNTWFNLHYHRNVFDNPKLMETVVELEAVASTAVTRMRYDLSSNAEIAIIYDRKSSPAFWANGALYNNYTRIGASVDFFPADDISGIDPEQYKMIVLISCPRLPPASLLHLERLKSGDRTILFLYAAGMETPQGLSTEAATQLSGFQFQKLPGIDRSVNIVGQWRKEFGDHIPALGKSAGPPNAFRLTVIPRTDDEVIGVSPTDNQVLFARHAYPAWTAYYLHNYQTHTHILRQLARLAGVTIHFSYNDSYFQRNKHFWLINSAAGNRELHVGNQQHIYDVFSDSMVPVKNGKVLLSMQPNETKLLLTDTLEKIEEFRQYYREYVDTHKITARPEKFEMNVLPNDKVLYVLAGVPREIRVRVRADRPFQGGALQLQLPDGWSSPVVEVDALAQYEVKTYTLNINAIAAGRQATANLQLRENDIVIMEQLLNFFSHDFFYLSDLKYISGRTGWGKIGHDRSCLNRPLRVDKQTFAKGIGVHAPSDLVYDLNGKWNRMTGLAGIDRSAGKGGMGTATCIFKIIGDGRELFNSGKQTGGDPPKPFDIDLSGIKQLKLMVEDAGDGRTSDHGDWCDVKLYSK